MSTPTSPDGRYRLDVSSQTESTDSGPVTYTETRYQLSVVEVATNKVVLTREEMNAWDDTASRGDYGLKNWRLTNTSLVLEYADKSTREHPFITGGKVVAGA